MNETPADILSAAAARKGWKAADIISKLAESGVEATVESARNWLTGRSVPLDKHRLPLVALFGLERDGFLTACALGTSSPKRRRDDHP